MKKLLILFILGALKLYAYKGPFYVSLSGSDTNSGTNTAPFATIQKAIALITAGTNYCNSPICYIAPGIYTQSIIILSNKNSFLKIASWSNIKPATLLLTNKNFIISNSPNITISNLIIKKSKSSGIKISNSTNIRIINSSILSNQKNGVSIESSYNIFIKGSIFHFRLMVYLSQIVGV